MSRYSIVEKPSYASWNSVLESSVNGNFEQTFEYGEIMKLSNIHTKVIRLLAMENRKPVGIVQGIYSEVFGLKESMIVGGGHGSGPVTIVKGEERSPLVRGLILALENFGARNRIHGLKVWWPDSWGMYDIFRDLNYKSIGKVNRFTVDLDKSVDELWKSIDSNKRKNVGKAIKNGVVVMQGNSHEDLLSFYRMLQASGKRAGFVHAPLSEFEATWQVYKPSIFLAKWKGKDVAGVLAVIHRNTVYARAAGSLEEAWSARPNDLLHWKVMEWACQQHFSKYHMGLVSEPVPAAGSGTWGLWRWKREWNGNLEIVHIFHKALYLPQIARAIELVRRRYESLTPRQRRMAIKLLRQVK